MALAGPLLLAAACSQRAAPSAVLDSGKVGSVAVGRSSRADVFAALGQPSRTERSAVGEAWIYEARTGDAGNRGWMNGVSAASGWGGKPLYRKSPSCPNTTWYTWPTGTAGVWASS